MKAKVKIGISACLLGQKVRYDGGDRRDEALLEALKDLVEWVPVCPEAELGLGVPREPMHLEGDAGQPRLITNDTRIDLTAAMAEWAARRAAGLTQEGLSGFVLKSRSPSCGRLDVPILSSSREKPTLEPPPLSSGLFALALMDRFPRLTLADELSLRDPQILASFIARARA